MISGIGLKSFLVKLILLLIYYHLIFSVLLFLITFFFPQITVHLQDVAQQDYYVLYTLFKHSVLSSYLLLPQITVHLRQSLVNSQGCVL